MKNKEQQARVVLAAAQSALQGGALQKEFVKETSRSGAKALVDGRWQWTAVSKQVATHFWKKAEALRTHGARHEMKMKALEEAATRAQNAHVLLRDYLALVICNPSLLLPLGADVVDCGDVTDLDALKAWENATANATKAVLVGKKEGAQ